MREFVVRSAAVASRDDLVAAFNEGLFRFAGGEWGGNLDAFHDLLSWPDDDSYRLVLSGWSECRAALAWMPMRGLRPNKKSQEVVVHP